MDYKMTTDELKTDELSTDELKKLLFEEIRKIDEQTAKLSKFQQILSDVINSGVLINTPQRGSPPKLYTHRAN